MTRHSNKNVRALATILTVFDNGNKSSAARMLGKYELKPFLAGALKARLGSVKGSYLLDSSVYGRFWIVGSKRFDPPGDRVPLISARTLYELALYSRTIPF